MIHSDQGGREEEDPFRSAEEEQFRIGAHRLILEGPTATLAMYYRRPFREYSCSQTGHVVGDLFGKRLHSPRVGDFRTEASRLEPEMRREMKILIGIIAVASVTAVLAITRSLVANLFRITVRTDQGAIRYGINDRDMGSNREQLVSLISKIGKLSGGEFEIRVDELTPFVRIAALVEDVKSKAPHCRYYVTYMDSTNRMKVFYDAQVYPDPKVDWVIVEELTPHNSNNRLVELPETWRLEPPETTPVEPPE